MSAVNRNSVIRGINRSTLAMVLTLVFVLTGSHWMYGKDKKANKADAEATQNKPKNILEGLDLSKIVWPNPPAITRIRYMNYFSGEKYDTKQQTKKKAGWMERVSGVATGEIPGANKPRFQLVVPYGVAVDSKGRVYIADSKVRAIFIVDIETGNFEMLKNGTDARFQWLTGLAVDDSDRLFAADSGMKRVLVFDPQHKVEGTISQGMRDPGGMAIDNENRLLYVTDAELDQVLVYDADPPYKLLRKLGTPDTQHKSTQPGDFSKPTNVAIDDDGNLYVTDTWNNRVEIFDAEGNFVRTFGKVGDGPGYFARPKGIAIDGDGHVWVADAMQNRVQVFTPEGQLLIWMGGPGLYPGQFGGLAGLAIDKNNRVFTSEQFPGRVQMFRYVNDEEAKAEKDRRDAAAKRKIDERRATATTAGGRPESSIQKPAAQKD